MKAKSNISYPLPPDRNSTNTKDKQKKMTITLPADIAAHLDWLSEYQGISLVEAIRKAIATESYLQQEIMRGGKVLIESNSQVKEVVFR